MTDHSKKDSDAKAAMPFNPMVMNMMPGGVLPPFPMNGPFPPAILMQGAPNANKKRVRSRRKGDNGMRRGMDAGATTAESDTRTDNKRADKRSFIATRGRERVQNDYNQRFVDTGERPQNFVRDVGEGKRFGEYPKLDRLSNLKREIITKRATPARYISADLRTFDFDSLRVLFDVVLINPPWRTPRMKALKQNFGWTLDDLIEHVPVDKIVDAMSFCFIWCDYYSLDDARAALRHWGFRKCEDICWLKTNATWSNTNADSAFKMRNNAPGEHQGLLHKTTERCLVGLRGPIRRNEDDYFVHSNLDTDVIIAEERDPRESLEMELNLRINDNEDIQMQMDRYLTKKNTKPQEIFDIIDRFCLGRRKLELFGSDDSIRNGWVTVGPAVTSTNYNADELLKWTSGNGCWPQVQDHRGGRLMGTSEEIENLRPKSPAKLTGKEAAESRDNMV
ncbi:MT-A70 family protein [Babesia bovis T2Bo]|uniref:MT-A70 family protein n=1 Tax=Babesia bovis TaxID=5865 RepID=A7AQX7_BABBO|nr:MT-A70 family protein [Babesia bovis T2Bo]EDO06946.1 MT-A70 family protein [Babesia bovis T2Bo]|eukprot:XP_001610514.1 hypothetical protein [Babesia bovis T2Bo]